MKNLILLFILFMQSACAGDVYYYNNNQKAALVPKDSLMRGSSAVDYYSTKDGVTLGVTDKLIVKVKSDSDVQKYLVEYNLTIEKELGQNLYLLKSSDKALTIDAANRLSEKEDVEYAHPDFIKKRMSR